MTHRCILCEEVLTNNASGLCDGCEERRAADIEHECLAAADDAAYTAECEAAARAECARRGIDPDAECADGGIEAWMIVDKELRDAKRAAADAAEDFNTQQDGHPAHD